MMHVAHEQRWYQQEAINSLFAYFRVSTGNPVVALPTGTGKSHVIGGFVKIAIQTWPATRVMILTHVKELITQNATKLYETWPHAPIGIYSAGLKRRDTVAPITFGGIASVVNNIEIFGHIDLLIIDECHLLSDKDSAMYQRVIAALKKINPYLKVIGLSATPFRHGVGMITEGSIFTDICYNMCSYENFNRLVAEGFLLPPIPSKRLNTQLDISNVGIHGGEFAQGAMQDAVDIDSITRALLRESCELGVNRRCWLSFASGVQHAEHEAEILNSYGIPSVALHSKLTNEQRDERIKWFKRGEIRCLTTNNIFTTGQDHPPIDFIIMARPTMRSGLWVQMIGRGTRPSPETQKINCLVADFAGNTRRLGPINDPIIPGKKGKGNGEIPIKLCEHCGACNHISIRFCEACGMEFSFEIKLSKTAGTEELLRTNKREETGLKSTLPEFEYFNVSHVEYNRHEQKNTGRISIKVTYHCGLLKYNEWLSFEAVGMWRKKSRDWWRQRYVKLQGEFVAEPPTTNAEALMKTSYLRAPARIRVWINKELPEVMDCEF